MIIALVFLCRNFVSYSLLLLLLSFVYMNLYYRNFQFTAGLFS